MTSPVVKVVCVTGCLGFIGSHFTRAALARGWQVWGVDKKDHASRPDHLAEFGRNPTFRFTEADIVHMDHLYDIDAVFNFAAQTHVDNSILDSRLFVHSNVAGVENLLELTRRRYYEIPLFVQVSTDEVYGDIAEGRHTETDALRPSNPYSASKAAAEMLVVAWHRTHGVPYLIVRPTNNYGVDQYPEKLIPKAVKYLSVGKKIPLHGDGSYIRNWLHVEDTVSAIMHIVDQGDRNRVYNIAGNYEASNRTIIEKVLACYHGAPVKIEDHVQFDYVRRGVDVRYSLDDSALRELGWEHRHQFDDELQLIIDHYRDRFVW